MATASTLDQTKLIVTIRGQKIEILLEPDFTVHDVKEIVGRQLEIPSNDIKLMFKGKVLSEPNENLEQLLQESSKTGKLSKTYRLMAVGLSREEMVRAQQAFEAHQLRAPRVRDDLSDQGRLRKLDRKRKGQLMLQQAAARGRGSSTSKYGFANIETLPGLPDEEKAKTILSSLANDPGILACMAKHEWNVGALSELYPEGKVGESAVCVMGLNESKGQRIKLRIRTDDLKGFRKPLSIRKVLFHELAHNVHSEHNGDFFLLMRQIEKECSELDWTKGAGLGLPIEKASSLSITSYQGGAFRLGDRKQNDSAVALNMTPSELRYHAAMQRMTPEEEEIELHCGCDRKTTNLFLPKPLQSTSPPDESKDDNP